MATINGTDLDDTLYGTSEGDSISGLGGNDVLVGFGGADNLDGGSGIDSAFYFDSPAGVGVNLATGKGVGGSAEGDTLVSIENVWGSSYNDTLTGNDGINELYGLDGNDVLKGGGGADRLDGGSGDDILKGGGGADFLQGGTGSDTADYSQSPPTVPGGHVGVLVDLYPGHFPGHGVGGDAQDDTFDSIENLTGSAYDDSLTGDDNVNVLRGLDGNDSLDGYGGNDTLDGGNGDDRLTGGGGNDILMGGPGADELNGDGNDDLGDYSDTADYSDKTVNVAVTLNTFNLVDVFVGGVAEDRIRNMENVTGGSGNDTLVGDSVANVLNGGAGNDRLDGGAGIDTMIGGAGNDVMYVDNVGDVITELAGEGNDQVRSSVSFTLGSNVENLSLIGTAAIDGTGNALNNIIIGNSAANLLRGGAGADTLKGGAGNDRLDGGAGIDTMIGGSGNDVMYVDNVGDVITELAGEGNDQVRSSVSFTLGSNVENLTLIGTAAIDGTGNALNNLIIGNSAANILRGGAGADTLKGEDGDDVLNGGDGNDKLYGGNGNDTLIGGVGLDEFVFDTALNAQTNADNILQFSVADDTIVLDDDIFTAGGPVGTLASEAFFTGTAAHDSSDRIIYDSATGNIYYDADGDGAGAQILFAQVAAGTALTNADFLIGG